ncbi:MAG: cation diffusion facilitator family transporter [Treponemataceae bacterium]
MKSKQNDRKRIIVKVTIIGFFINFFLSLAKLLAGIFGKSGAMIADAVHSLSDFATDIIVLFIIPISTKPHDEDHPYGHGKYEILATIIIGSALLFVAGGILFRSITVIKNYFLGITLERPEIFAIIAALISIIIKEFLFHYTLACGKKLKSPVLIANSWHQRSDALSSIGALIGITLAFFLGEKWRIFDPIAAIIVSILILKVAIELIIPAANDLLEKSLPIETENEILEIISFFPNVSDPHKMKTRSIGVAHAIEFHIRVAENMSVKEAHEITFQIENKIIEKYGDQTQIIIHVEPLKKSIL